MPVAKQERTPVVAVNGSAQMPVDVFATCPASHSVDQQQYLQRVADIARWSERAGCRGILVYSDNSLADPWLVSQIIIQNTAALCPLVAVQPIYMHPYSVAKMVTTFAFLYGRRIYLNMVAGGFKNDLVALNDETPHDQRYHRLIEYTTVIKKLLASGLPTSFEGEFYRITNLALKPPLPPELLPGIFVSGSSEAGMQAAQALEATAVKYPEPPAHYESQPPPDYPDCGLRVGIIARDNDDAAWRIALERFPEDRKGQLTHQLAMKVSDSLWHKQLSERGEERSDQRDTYWLGPFQNYKTFCPYLVGSYEKVATELHRYIARGYKKFILDIPANEEELHHIGVVFEQASRGMPA